VESSKAVGVAVAEAQGQFGNPEEGKHLLSETRKQVLTESSEDVTMDTSV
jgi:hypothetical protein